MRDARDAGPVTLDPNLRADGLREALSKPPLLGARALSLRDQGRDGAFLAALLNTPGISTVELLDLSSNPIGVEGAEALGSRPLLALRTLDLSETALGDAGAEALAGATWPSLGALALDTAGVGPDGGRALAHMAALRGVAALSIAGASDLWDGGPKPFLGPRGFAALVSSPNLANLRELRVPLNAVGDEGARALAQATHLTALRAVDLRANDIGDAGATALIGAPHLRGLEHLDLRDNPLSDDVKAALRGHFGDQVAL